MSSATLRREFPPHVLDPAAPGSVTVFGLLGATTAVAVFPDGTFSTLLPNLMSYEVRTQPRNATG